LLLYIQNIVSNEEQLNRLGETMPVSAKISNSNGSREMGLVIGFDMLHKAMDTGMITNEVITTQAFAKMSNASEEERAYNPSINYIGTNSFSAFNAFSSKDASYIDSYDESFLKSDEAVCIIRNTFMKEREVNPGDDLEIEVYIMKYTDTAGTSFTFDRAGIIKLRVIGSYTTSNNYASDELPDILVPIAFAEHAYEEMGAEGYANSARFTLKDPLRINEFKSAMKEIGFRSAKYTGNISRTGKTLIAYDQTFIQTATHIKESLVLLQRLAPLIVLI